MDQDLSYSETMQQFLYIYTRFHFLLGYVCDVVLANFAKAFDYPDLIDALQASIFLVFLNRINLIDLTSIPKLRKKAYGFLLF